MTNYIIDIKYKKNQFWLLFHKSRHFIPEYREFSMEERKC